MLKLGPVLVMTPEFDLALEFYRDALGLRLVQRAENQLIFEVGGASLHVFRCERAAGAGRHGVSASSVICFEVPSIDRAMFDLRERGVTFIHDRPTRNDVAGLSYAAFEAPGGNVHELVERH